MSLQSRTLLVAALASIMAVLEVITAIRAHDDFDRIWALIIAALAALIAGGSWINLSILKRSPSDAASETDRPVR